MALRVTIHLSVPGPVAAAAAETFERLLQAWDGDELETLLPSGEMSSSTLLDARDAIAERLWSGAVRHGQLALAPMHREARWEFCDATDPTQRHQGLALLAATEILARLLGSEGVIELRRNE